MRKIVYKAATVAILLGSFFVFACWSSTSQNGSGIYLEFVAQPLLALYVLLLLGLFFQVAFTTLRLLLRVKRTDKEKLKLRFLFFITSVICMTPLLVLGGYYRGHGLKVVVKQAEPIIAAIGQYQNKFGNLPDNLNALVPDFASEIPVTGLSQQSRYLFAKLTNNQVCFSNKWLLYVPLSSTRLNHYELVYLPLQNYPEDCLGKYPTKNGDWAVMTLTLK